MIKVPSLGHLYFCIPFQTLFLPTVSLFLFSNDFKFQLFNPKNCLYNNELLPEICLREIIRLCTIYLLFCSGVQSVRELYVEAATTETVSQVLKRGNKESG